VRSAWSASRARRAPSAWRRCGPASCPTACAWPSWSGTAPSGSAEALHADLGFRAPDDPTSRYFDPALGGGALLDVGVYPVALAQQLLGAPEQVQVSGSLTATGVDGDVALLLRCRGGASALLSASITSHAASAAWVEGTAGRVEVPRSFERMPALHLHRPDRAVEVVDLGRLGTGYAHMLQHVQDCLAEGRQESPVMPLSDTLDVMRVVDAAQRALGLSPRDDG
jgi:predicted dehydrogenase